MRKVVLGLGISLDGYIARKNGAVDWLSMDWDYDWTAFFKTIDVVLMGRKSWDAALAMSAPEPKSKSEKKAEASNPYAGMETYVFSKTLKESGAEGVEIFSGNLAEFVAGLKAKEGKNIWLSGGGELAKSFLDAGLVDEIYLGVTPLLLGSGLPLFPELIREVPLRFVSCNVCRHKKEDNAMLELVYEVKKG
ncbi:MAG TPA: dihydrofolate reductase family protein [Pyrinomonadaceae bacterium]|nr:dihydrofolate reductase family protein [Pyrinomonadaceae bacterium]